MLQILCLCQLIRILCSAASSGEERESYHMDTLVCFRSIIELTSFIYDDGGLGSHRIILSTANCTDITSHSKCTVLNIDLLYICIRRDSSFLT